MISRSSMGRPRRLAWGGAGASFLGAEFSIFVRLMNDLHEAILVGDHGVRRDVGLVVLRGSLSFFFYGAKTPPEQEKGRRRALVQVKRTRVIPLRRHTKSLYVVFTRH